MTEQKHGEMGPGNMRCKSSGAWLAHVATASVKGIATEKEETREDALWRGKLGRGLFLSATSFHSLASVGIAAAYLFLIAQTISRPVF